MTWRRFLKSTVKRWSLYNRPFIITKIEFWAKHLRPLLGCRVKTTVSRMWRLKSYRTNTTPSGKYQRQERYKSTIIHQSHGYCGNLACFCFVLFCFVWCPKATPAGSIVFVSRLLGNAPSPFNLFLSLGLFFDSPLPSTHFVIQDGAL